MQHDASQVIIIIIS